MQLPWSRHVKFYFYFIEVTENAIASQLFVPGIFHWFCGIWAESFLVGQIFFRLKFEWVRKKTFCLQNSHFISWIWVETDVCFFLFFKFEHLFFSFCLSWIWVCKSIEYFEWVNQPFRKPNASLPFEFLCGCVFKVFFSFLLSLQLYRAIEHICELIRSSHKKGVPRHVLSLLDLLSYWKIEI